MGLKFIILILGNLQVFVQPWLYTGLLQTGAPQDTMGCVDIEALGSRSGEKEPKIPGNVQNLLQIGHITLKNDSPPESRC